MKNLRQRGDIVDILSVYKSENGPVSAELYVCQDDEGSLILIRKVTTRLDEENSAIHWEQGSFNHIENEDSIPAIVKDYKAAGTP